MAKWLLQNHHEVPVFLISPWQGNRRGDIHLLQYNVSNWRLTTILRLRISMKSARWNSLITLETASRVEKIMFASSWCVRRPEAVGQVREQRCQARRHLPVQETIDRLLGLPKALGE